MALLERYSWPGNVRELQNVVDSAIVVASSDTIRPKDLPASIQQGESAHVWGFGDADHEPKRAKMAAKRSRGAMTAAAAALGISRTTLWRHLRDARASTLVGERADRAMANDAPAPVRRRDEPEKRPSRPRQSRTTMLNDAES
jgi:DNA-binding NtrC family response regulator